MYPEDRVLIGVINRKRDFVRLEAERWYRIPQARMPDGVGTEYLGFFLSGKVFKAQSGGVHYYARVNGVELARRRDLLPDEADHPRADDVYYRLALGPLQTKTPPILNPTRRVVAFIFTTGDRFSTATQISDLYSDADHLVDRVYHVLRTRGVESQRAWDAQRKQVAHAPGLRINWGDGVLNVSAKPDSAGDALHVDMTAPDDKILAALQAEITRRGGPMVINVPMDGLN